MNCDTVIDDDGMCYIQIPSELFLTLDQNTDDGCLHCSKKYSYIIQCELFDKNRIRIILTINSDFSSWVFHFIFKSEMLKSMEQNTFCLIDQESSIPKDEDEHCHLLGLPCSSELFKELEPIITKLSKKTNSTSCKKEKLHS